MRPLNGQQALPVRCNGSGQADAIEISLQVGQAPSPPAGHSPIWRPVTFDFIAMLMPC